MLSSLREEDIDGYSDVPDPPPAALEQWSKAECRTFLEGGGTWKPLLERTSYGAMLSKLGWRTRLEKATSAGRPAAVRAARKWSMSQLGAPLGWHSVRGETRSTSAASTTPLALMPRT